MTVRSRKAHLLHVGAIAATGGVVLCAIAHDARAQAIDENPPLPNVLVLLDNSGSMERMIDGSLVEANSAHLSPSSVCIPGAQASPNRWGIAMQALTGDITPYYSCLSEPRTTTPAAGLATDFVSEYKINGIAPYDQSYFLPYHRPLSGPVLGWTVANSCALSPARLPGATAGTGVGPTGAGYAGGSLGQYATDYPADAIAQRFVGTVDVGAPPFANTCTFTQLADGALDAGRDFMRFGLMTFDSDTGNGIGVSGAAGSQTVLTGNPFGGMWSYFPGWNTGSPMPASGNLPGCVNIPWEVGARNAAAPPWEGRMIPLPASAADINAVHSTNDQVQLTIGALRPYGATPTTALFADAYNYFINDASGPKQSDPLVNSGGCRQQYIILLTDGAPNEDMLPNCGGTGGSCPYQWLPASGTPATPDAIAGTLYNGTKLSGNQVSTFVIGFATSSVADTTPVLCSSVVLPGPPAHIDPTICSDPTKLALYGPCCTLEKIAIAGGTQHAYFADSAGALNSALASIFAQISSQTTTRTVPAYSPIVANPSVDPTKPVAQTSTFLASFNPGIGRPWWGDIQRQAQTCNFNAGTKTFTQGTPGVNYAAGDDFEANLDSHAGLTARTFYAVQPGILGGPVDATAIIRPYVGTTPIDGLGTYGGTLVKDSVSASGGTLSTMLSGITPSALNITATSPSQCANSTGTAYLTPANCEALAFDYLFGLQNTPGLTTQPAAPAAPLGPDSSGFLPFLNRWCTAAGCLTGAPDVSAFGDIFHATPVVVPKPSALLADEAYQRFVANYSANPPAAGTVAAGRKTFVYATTNDGLLHSFWADAQPTAPQNNEYWSFVPPAVMPSLLQSYPSSHQLLLDGAPVAKDVVWQRQSAIGASLNVGNCATGDSTCDWHTMVVGSYGSQGRGYYALDVTKPDPTTTPKGAPDFRWSLTKMGATAGVAGSDIFGIHSGTPVMTTISTNVTLTGTGGATQAGISEIGVAILPGGMESGPNTGKCQRASTIPTSGSYLPRANVRCWGATNTWTDPVIGRSVSVVRLDTGEIIKTFIRNSTAAADLPSSHPLVVKKRVNDTQLDSPMTGVPVVYPAETGAIAEKVFIGDADGTIWKFDLSDPNPDNWKGTLFVDSFNQTVDKSTTSWSDGTPIQVPPVISLDRQGSLVVGFATGDQENYTSAGTNYIYSVGEKPQGLTSTLGATVNWYEPLTSGERVSGPLAVFDTAMYVSTFKPTAGGGCSIGVAHLWGMDYQTPNNTSDLSQGGVPRLTIGGGSPAQSYDPTGGSSTSPLAGKVIPGVSINFTPACADLSGSGSDAYAAGQTHTTANSVLPGSYSLFVSYGGKGASGTGSGNANFNLPPPQTASVIDSWASVVE